MYTVKSAFAHLYSAWSPEMKKQKVSRALGNLVVLASKLAFRASQGEGVLVPGKHCNLLFKTTVGNILGI